MNITEVRIKTFCHFGAFRCTARKEGKYKKKKHLLTYLLTC